jgi:AcrR family transcriptional regulator
MTIRVREDPRVTRTRQLIFKAFQELLSEKDFESLTVQDITDRATVNRATFYAHFEDKYGLLDAAFDEEFKRELHNNLSADSVFSLMNLELLIQTVCEFLEKLYSHCASSGETQFRPLVERQVKTNLTELLLRWLTRSGASRNDAELRATITSWAIYGTAVSWTERKRKESVKEFAREALPMIAAGMEQSLPPMRKKAK